MKRAGPIAAVIVSIASSTVIAVALAHGHYSPILVLLWTGSITLWVVAWPRVPSGGTTRSAWWFALACLPAVVRWVLLDTDRIHGDGLLTGYFSTTYDLWRTNFFAPVPRDPGQWVSQFPSPFFVFQKLFFLAFGESLLSVKASVLPYTILIAALLFGLVRRLRDERAAAIAVAIYAFHGPSLYLETLGLHFASSTAVLLAFFLAAVRASESGAPRHAATAGAFCGACYLTYTSSYVALPLYLGFFVRDLIRRPVAAIGNAAVFLVAFALVLAPFAVYALHEPTHYARRIQQVSLLDGEWSSARARIERGESATKVMRDSLELGIRSLIQPSVGGHGGYDFGRLALFDRFSLSLLALGTLYASWLALRRPEWLLMLAAIAVAFLAGTVLTIPPPAFHRMSGAFPFLAVIMTLPIDGVLRLRGHARPLGLGLGLFALGFAPVSGLNYFAAAAAPERYQTDFALANYVGSAFPGRPLYVAAFATHSFEKIYYFSPEKSAVRVHSDAHVNQLRDLNSAEKYVYVMTLPAMFEDHFRRRDPAGRIIRYSRDYSLFVN